MDPLIIAGGGLSGCLAALALARLRPEVPFLLVEAGERFGGNHIWSFFDSDLSPPIVRPAPPRPRAKRASRHRRPHPG